MYSVYSVYMCAVCFSFAWPSHEVLMCRKVASLKQIRETKQRHKFAFALSLSPKLADSHIRLHSVKI